MRIKNQQEKSKTEVNSIIEKIRKMPRTVNVKRESICILLVVFIGLLLGYIAKATDSVSVIGDIGTNLGVWIFVGVLISVYSSTPLLAALKLPIFFISMLAAYYIYGWVVLGVFPKNYFMSWLIMAALSPIGAVATWFSRGKGWPAIIGTALPVAVLFSEGYPAFYTHKVPLFADLAFGIILLVILPKTFKQRILSLIASCILTVVIIKFDVLAYLPW